MAVCMSVESKSLDILVAGDLFIDLIMSGFALESIWMKLSTQ